MCHAGFEILKSRQKWCGIQKYCGVFQLRKVLSCVVSGRWCWGIAVKSGAVLKSGKSIFFRGGEEWVSGAEEVGFVGRHGEYSYSGSKD